MLEEVALTGGDGRFQKVAPVVIHPSRDVFALETPSYSCAFLRIQGEESQLRQGISA
jgi:hypothetical protein